MEMKDYKAIAKLISARNPKYCPKSSAIPIGFINELSDYFAHEEDVYHKERKNCQFNRVEFIKDCGGV